jgi:hypothetical protein
MENNMIKEFVPYKESIELKELGFNEPCFAFYQIEYSESRPTMVDDDNQYRLTGYRTCNNSEIPEHYTSAPTFSQVFDWFRIKHNLLSWIYSSTNIEYWYTIIGDGRFVKSHDGETTYEGAKLECLRQLIKIVKESQKVKTPKKEFEINAMITDCEDETPESISDKLIEFIEEKGWITTGIVKTVEHISNNR